MGQVISATCEACGLEDHRVVIGGGMATYRERSMWPINCHSCHDLRSTNICREPLSCEMCGSSDVAIYGAKRPWGSRYSSDEIEAAMWGEYRLPEGPHTCPRCGEVSLLFTSGSGIMFD